jgi:hypothetical protein
MSPLGQRGIELKAMNIEGNESVIASLRRLELIL